MTILFRSRLVSSNQVVFDQADFYQADLYTKVSGLTPSDVSLTLTFNNVALNWPLISGTGILDNQVAAGSVYWNALPSNSYGLRFFPNAVGAWALELGYGTGAPAQRIKLFYDILPISCPSGINISFI